MGKNVLVTGSNGFIGSHLVEKLLAGGDTVNCMVRRTSNLNWLKDLEIKCVYGDFRDPAALEAAVRDKDEIYHLGGIVRSVGKKNFYKINSAGTRNIAEAVNKVNPEIRRFVYVSSQAAWGPLGMGPVSHYGMSKAEGEGWVKQVKNFSIVRPVAVYGPRDRDFLSIMKMAARGVFLVPGYPGKLSFIHIDDCVRGIINAPLGREVFVSDGKEYEWEDLRAALEKALKKRVHTVRLPETLVRMMGIFGSIAGRITGKPVPLNADKVKEILGGDWIVPESCVNARYSLEDGIKQTYIWYKNNGWM